MINKKMVEALNKQINEEMYSGYLYLAMSADFQEKNLNGFANWMRIQSQEELSHAMKMYNYVIERGGRVILETIKKPAQTWNTTLDAFEAAYKHECMISGKIGELVDLALQLKDHATNIFLQWFVSEQVEEEASVDEIVQQIKMLGDHRSGIYMLNRELGNRVFATESDGSE